MTGWGFSRDNISTRTPDQTPAAPFFPLHNPRNFLALISRDFVAAKYRSASDRKSVV